jgi:divalent metal cation (Fe/Co/Zn/Cd) transporter
VALHSLYDLASQHHAGASPVGIAVAAIIIVIMPLLARATHRRGARLGSAATQGEGAQNMLRAAMATAVHIGLAGQAPVGAWWLDPMAGLFIVGVAVKSGLDAWRGDACDDCLPVGFDVAPGSCASDGRCDGHQG